MKSKAELWEWFSTHPHQRLDYCGWEAWYVGPRIGEQYGRIHLLAPGGRTYSYPINQKNPITGVDCVFTFIDSKVRDRDTAELSDQDRDRQAEEEYNRQSEAWERVMFDGYE